MRPKSRWIHLLLPMACLLLLLAPVTAAKHTITVTSGSPKTGDHTMRVDVQNFNLVPFAGKTKMKGEGHIHYLANGEDACSAQKADCKAPTDYATPAKSFTFRNLKPGDKLQAELVLSDHTASGTDASGNLDGSRVLSAVLEVKGGGIPGPGAALVLLGLVGALAWRRRDP